jgi:hypothetical protein
MAPAASTTDVCPDRAAHPALSVRHVQVTPAAERARHLTPVAPNRNRNARRRPAPPAGHKYRNPPPCDGRARTAPRRTHAPFMHTRCARTRTQPDQEARAHTYTHTHTRLRARAHAHTRTHPRTRAHTQTRTRTRISRHASARDRTNQRAHSSCPRDMHAIHVRNSIGGCIYLCRDGGRATRANGLKCVRGWVGLVRAPWVSLDYPASIPL